MTLTPVPEFWHVFEPPLAWLERLAKLMQFCGGLHEDERLVLRDLGLWLLRAACGQPCALDTFPETPAPTPTPEPTPAPPAPTAEKPKGRPPRVPTAPANGHPEPGGDRWSLNDRLRHLGYPEDLDRGTRIALGQRAVERYKFKHHGKAPAMSEDGRQGLAKRVALYDAADLPLLDTVIHEMLGGLIPAEGPVAVEGANMAKTSLTSVGSEADSWSR
jgi:hypothetical protein